MENRGCKVCLSHLQLMFHKCRKKIINVSFYPISGGYFCFLKGISPTQAHTRKCTQADTQTYAVDTHTNTHAQKKQNIIHVYTHAIKLTYINRSQIRGHTRVARDAHKQSESHNDTGGGVARLTCVFIVFISPWRRREAQPSERSHPAREATLLHTSEEHTVRNHSRRS